MKKCKLEEGKLKWYPRRIDEVRVGIVAIWRHFLKSTISRTDMRHKGIFKTIQVCKLLLFLSDLQPLII